MASSSGFGAFIDFAESFKPQFPKELPAVYRKQDPTTPSAYELEALKLSSYNGSKTTTGTHTPATPNDLEMSRPPSPSIEAPLIQTWRNPYMNRWRVLCACLVYFGNGMMDSAPGALIPYMETDYNIGYAIVSLIFVTNAVGFIAAAFFTDPLSSKLGRSKSLMLSEVLLIVACTMISCNPPFSIVVLAFFFLGVGYAINLALNNVFCSNLADSTIIGGLSHGSYGLGGMVGPICATAMVSTGILWSRYYIVVIGVRVFCFFYSAWAFHNYEKEDSVQLLAALEHTATERDAADTCSTPSTPSSPATGKRALLKEALRNKVTLIGALFIFAYQGAEVSISGWVISFLITYRGGEPDKVGYVTAGFWAGITLGRFTLTHVAHRVGERAFVFCTLIGAAVFQLLLWFVPNVIGDAVAVAVLGLLLGPIYPCAQTIFSRLLPRKIQTVSVGFIASAGSSGGAIAPFTTGLLAQAVGTWALHPVCVALYAAAMACWLAIPKVVKPRE